MAVTVDYTPAIFNYWLSGIDDDIEMGTGTDVNGLYAQTAVIDGVTWTKTHDSAVQASAGTATDIHVITNSNGFSATSVELVNYSGPDPIDWVIFDNSEWVSETWTGDFGNFTAASSDTGTAFIDTFTGTMTTVAGDVLEAVNIVVTFEGYVDFPSALEGTATLNGEVVTFDSSMLLQAEPTTYTWTDTAGVVHTETETQNADGTWSFNETTTLGFDLTYILDPVTGAVSITGTYVVSDGTTFNTVVAQGTYDEVNDTVVNLTGTATTPAGDSVAINGTANGDGFIFTYTDAINTVHIVTSTDDAVLISNISTPETSTNTAPVVNNPIADVIVNEGEHYPSNFDPDALGWFTDADGDQLTYTFHWSEDATDDVESLAVFNNGNALEIMPVGEEVVTVIATDPSGATATQTMKFIVNAAETTLDDVFGTIPIPDAVWDAAEIASGNMTLNGVVWSYTNTQSAVDNGTTLSVSYSNDVGYTATFEETESVEAIFETIFGSFVDSAGSNIIFNAISNENSSTWTETLNGTVGSTYTFNNFSYIEDWSAVVDVLTITGGTLTDANGDVVISPGLANNATIATGTIAAVVVDLGEAVNINPADYFTDVDGDVLTYTISIDGDTPQPWIEVANGTTDPDNVGSHTMVLIATDPSGASATQTFTVTVNATTDASELTTYDLAGVFTMKDALGDAVGTLDETLTGSLSINHTTGEGTIEMTSTQAFYGVQWTATDITISKNADSTYSSAMTFTWGTSIIAVTLDLDATFNDDGTATLTTLDGPGADGIIGNPMDNGPFVGFNAGFDFALTSGPESVDIMTILDTDFIVGINANLTNDAYPTATVSGNIESNDYRDEYIFSVQAGETFIFDVEHNSLSGEIGDSTLTILDADGNQLAYNDDATGYGDNESGDYDPYIQYTFTDAGSYTAVVKGFSTGSIGTYELSLSKFVAATNTAPVATNDTATTDEDTAVTIDVLTNDTDADSADILSDSDSECRWYIELHTKC